MKNIINLTLKIILFFAIFNNIALADLLIIDMQSTFLDKLLEPKKNELITNVSTKIEEAVKNNDLIIFVEIAWARESTHSSLLKLVENYSNFIRIIKCDGDGSAEIKKKLDEMNLKPNSLDICGVNTSACVKETVTGLVNVMRDVPKHVYPDLCYDCEPFSSAFPLLNDQTHAAGLSFMSRLYNVYIKESKIYEIVTNDCGHLNFKTNDCCTHCLNKSCKLFSDCW